MSDVDHPHVRLNFDTGNIAYYNQGADPCDELEQVKHLVRNVHLKDNRGGFEDWYFPAVGDGGSVDFDAVREILDGVGFAGPYTIEIEGIGGEPEPGWKSDTSGSVAASRTCEPAVTSTELATPISVGAQSQVAPRIDSCTIFSQTRRIIMTKPGGCWQWRLSRSSFASPARADDDARGSQNDGRRFQSPLSLERELQGVLGRFRPDSRRQDDQRNDQGRRDQAARRCRPSNATTPTRRNW